MTKTNAIAIDGPAGAGKSTIAKNLARELGIIYVDTGAMYRAMAIHMLRGGIKLDDIRNATDGHMPAAEALLPSAEVKLGFEGGEQQVYLGEENVTGILRTQEVGDMASAVSTNEKVRARMVELQQEIARENSVIMDGRDIGTVVLPDAKLKVYLTASVAERAKRRYLEQKEKNPDMTLTVEDIAREIEERDHRDMTRTHSPLRRADDAVELDTTGLTIPEVTARVLSLWKKTE
ncbi:MAG: (d)CMP kinase [Lachnospiraceae bacterium]|nr:(d)CMP kinase [Lachnospiraceae bacterium]